MIFFSKKGIAINTMLLITLIIVITMIILIFVNQLGSQGHSLIHWFEGSSQQVILG